MVTWKRPKESFWKLLPQKGYPTKLARWCCDILKEKPTKDVPLKHRLVGIRAEESAKRAKRAIIDSMGKWILYKPIFTWLEWEIWDYIDDNGLEYCSLYDEGFHRMGCVVCPFLCGPNQYRLNVHRERWPKQYRAFEKGMFKLYHSNHKKSIIEIRKTLSFEEFLSNWYRGK